MKFKSRVYAPGPTPVPEKSRLSMAESTSYHRTEECSELIRNVTEGIQDLLGVSWPVVSLSASGTGAMQMAAENLTHPDETVLVIEAGKFGERWRNILQKLGRKVIRYDISWNKSAEPEEIEDYFKSYPEITSVFGTLVETSSLVRHPVEDIGKITQENDKLFVVDAISGFAAEYFKPSNNGVDAVVIGSQKGLMVPPGLSFFTVNKKAEQKSRNSKNTTTYFDLPKAIDRLQEDSQTPWTPAINLLKSASQSVKKLLEEGLQSLHNRHSTIATICQEAVRGLGLQLFASNPSVVGTSLIIPDRIQHKQLQNHIYEEYNTYIPGGQKHLDGKILRLGHLGYVDYFDLVVILSTLEQGLMDFNYDLEPGKSMKIAQRMTSRK